MRRVPCCFRYTKPVAGGLSAARRFPYVTYSTPCDGVSVLYDLCHASQKAGFRQPIQLYLNNSAYLGLLQSTEGMLK
jgi:hypothetical protein